MAQDLVNKFRNSNKCIHNFGASLPDIEDCLWTKEFAMEKQQVLRNLWDNHEHIEEEINNLDNNDLDITTEAMTEVEEEYRRIQGLIDLHVSIWNQPGASSTMKQHNVSYSDHITHQYTPSTTSTAENPIATYASMNSQSQHFDYLPKSNSTNQSTPIFNSTHTPQLSQIQRTPQSNSISTAPLHVQQQLTSNGYNPVLQYTQSAMPVGQHQPYLASTFSYAAPRSIATLQQPFYHAPSSLAYSIPNSNAAISYQHNYNDLSSYSNLYAQAQPYFAHASAPTVPLFNNHATFANTFGSASQIAAPTSNVQTLPASFFNLNYSQAAQQSSGQAHFASQAYIERLPTAQTSSGQPQRQDLCNTPSPFAAQTSSSQGRNAHAESRAPSNIDRYKYQNMKLVPIDLPHFSGEYTEWEEFHDLFMSMIHENPYIPNVQKMHRLKSAITGEAASLIKHISCTEGNYAIAWDKLRRRYQNERIIIMNHIDNIVKIPKMTSSSTTEIKLIIDRTADSIEALRKMNQPVDSWSVWLVYHLVQKLDAESRCLWEQKLGKSTQLPTYDQLADFLEDRFRVLESLASAGHGKINPQDSNRRSVPKYVPVKAHFANKKMGCEFCNGQHHILTCSKFKNEELDDRRAFTNKKRLCFRCLESKCFYRKCKDKSGCTLCPSRHHTLLHKDRPDEEDRKKTHAHLSNVETKQDSIISTNTKITQPYPNNVVLLATAMLRIKLKNKEIVVRALLDQGSESSFVTSEIIKKFGIPTKSTNVIISGISSSSGGLSTSIAALQMSSTAKPVHQFNVNALVIDNITGYLPSKTIQRSIWEHASQLELADSKFYEPRPVDMLLGADVYAELIENGVQKGPKGTPTAQKTKIGWILSGVLFDNDRNVITKTLTTNSRETTDRCLEKFWQLEEISNRKLPSKDDLQCEQHFKETHSRSSDGRFIVKLPFKSSIELGDSRKMAEIRLLQMEKRFSRSQPFFERYRNFIDEYLQMGHMEKLNEIDQQRPIGECYYLPHHAVLKEESTTTKLRVVFDGSCKSSNGISLNSKLFVGPTIQDDLVSILMRWRIYQFAYSADIAKMYRMINMNKEDANYQRILWRENPYAKMEEFKLTTVTYGTSSAAYLAIRSLRQLAESEESNYPLAATITLRDFYVDDCISGAHDIRTALEQQNQLIKLLQSGGFELRKWTSNNQTILENVPECHRETKLPLDLLLSESVKTLGIRWNPVTDTFSFKVNLSKTSPRTTKRRLLSEVSKLFDPLGWLAPIVIKCKMLYQQLWIAALNWDDSLPADLETAWQQQRQQLYEINDIQIPRWLCSSLTTATEIHGFCDASSLGYGACVYTRILQADGTYIVRLITAKSKVAPVKTISIPRLELCGAVMLKRLIDKVKEAMFSDSIPVFAWSDSQIVLHWIRGHPRERQTFVANRITEIHETLSSTNWLHIPSELNPADCISRGMATQDLIRHDLWWYGPQFLQKCENWPITTPEVPSGVDLEQRKVHVIKLNATNYTDFLRNCTSLRHLQRVTAYGQRFLRNSRQKIKELRQFGHLQPYELQNAMVFWIKAVQSSSFPDEYSRLMTSRDLLSRSKLLSLQPFRDEDGLLRVGGRLKNALIHYDEKHPIILPKNHHLTDFIIQDAHERTMHGGPQLTLSHTRRKFWIMEGKNQVKRILHRCVTCFKNAPKPCQQLMGQLPAPRVTPCRPFQKCGIDFAGPLQTRISKGRGCRAYKSYIAVIVCFTTKAVHLELVSDLTAAALLAALRRFIARRGLCTDIFSDNATNFRRAAKDLEKDLAVAIHQATSDVAESLANDGVTWHFIPPASPHFGGLWEAGVRSVKHHLVRVIGSHTLTYEEMTTVLHQIEAALNSRPLTPLTTNANDLQALTPGHFLIGTALTTFPEPNIADATLISRWDLLQKMYQSFWKRWYMEYINNLQQRPKWKRTQINLEIGQLVIIKDDQLPPTKWSLGRVVATHPGPDGLVRVATVKSSTSTKKYPVVKLCLLPIEDNEVTTATAGEDV